MRAVLAFAAWNAPLMAASTTLRSFLQRICDFDRAKRSCAEVIGNARVPDSHLVLIQKSSSVRNLVASVSG